ncbi:MAG: Gfo/Idh/MocA family oxidoreductase [Proteobacteria bacterium]|nr:Gfo/Idh/MocA family oxidoreductase [Pseudomonadota bacterium]MBU4599623.1 Gfo/Idh/MocA family oxidoreductase [Pseudomonadota bacterium]MBV1716119.1 Gfo/Idh/MocA family oxidoreductase [Desulfarculus sp.]
MDKKIKPKKMAVAVVGSGYWGKNLVRNYYELNCLKIICDKNESILEDFRRQYEGIETCLALSDILGREDVDGVVVATPAETHYSIAREALLAGKHVYIEKPLVTEEKDCQDLIILARKQQRVLMVGHLLQYHPVFVRLKELIGEGVLGRINYIYSHRLNLGKIRREENILWSFAPHDISMILALAGEEPESVYATGGNYLHKRIADVTTTHLNFSSGLKAHIFVSWLHPFKEQKLVVVGEEKMAVFDDTQPWEDKLLLYPHKINWQNNAPVPMKGEAERVEITQAEPLRMECLHFLQCMADGNKPLTDGEEGLRVLKVLKNCQTLLEQENPQINQVASTDPPPPVTGDFFVHGTALLDENVSIGAGSKIWHFSHVLSYSQLGENCNIGQNVVIGPNVTIGKGCKIQNNVSVYKGVTLEDYVFCGPSMVFTNIYNPRAAIRKMDQVRETLVRTGASLGANCTIVCGTTIGRYAFVGAGSVVNRDVADHSLVVGNPARHIGWVCQCGERLDENLACPVCQKTYRSIERGLILNSKP